MVVKSCTPLHMDLCRPIFEPLEGRLLFAGSGLDSSYGNNGLLTVDKAVESGDVIRTTFVQDDGKLLLIGTAGGSDLLMTRYNTDGTLDDSFGTGGRVVIDFALANDDGDISTRGVDVAQASDGSIYALATLVDGRSVSIGYGLARFTDAGVIDTKFSEDGAVISSAFEDDTSAAALLVANDGSVMAGITDALSGFDVFHYDVQGNLLSEFGMNLGNWPGTALTSLQLDNFGRIVATGSVDDDDLGSAKFIARFNSDGQTDTSLDDDGVVVPTNPLLKNTEQAAKFTDVALLPDGNMLLSLPPISGQDPSIIRLLEDGSLDTTYGDSGAITFDFGANDRINDLLVQSDGTVLVSGVVGAQPDLYVARLNADGTLEQSFASGGKIQIDFGGNETGGLLAMRPDGNVVLIGGDGAPTSLSVVHAAGLNILPPAPSPGPGADPAFIDEGALRIVGTAEADEIRIFAEDDNIVVDFNGDDYTFAAADVTEIFATGGKGDDRIRISGIAIAARLSGGDGNDILRGGSGDDHLRGGEGKDSLDGGFGADLIEGDDGFDTVTYASRSSKVVVALNGDVSSGRADENDRVKADVESIVGGSGNDELHGNKYANTLIGGGGNDQLFGKAGNDKLYGKNGRDTLTGASGNDYLDGGEDKDTVHGNDGRDTILGGNGADALHGDAGADRFFTRDSTKDSIFGGAEDDWAEVDAKDVAKSIQTLVEPRKLAASRQ